MVVARKNVSKVEKKESELTSGSEGSEKRNFPIITHNAISFFFWTSFESIVQNLQSFSVKFSVGSVTLKLQNHIFFKHRLCCLAVFTCTPTVDL